MLSTMMCSLSSPQELANALAAFDEDDSGQIDADELRDALLHTSPDGAEEPLTAREINEVLKGFTGRRMFGGKFSGNPMSGSNKRGDVFRYHEFVTTAVGNTNTAATSGGRGAVKG